MDSYFQQRILYNRQEEELETKVNPLGVIRRMIQIKLEEENTAPESGMERIHHFQALQLQAKEIILAEYR